VRVQFQPSTTRLVNEHGFERIQRKDAPWEVCTQIGSTATAAAAAAAAAATGATGATGAAAAAAAKFHFI